MNDSFDTFTLTPMSAGDIIDRAVRLYRRNFLVLLRIVLAPSIVAYAGVILYSIGMHNFSLERGDTRVASTVLLIIGGSLLYVIGQAAFYAVLGGASRSLVYHFFDGTPLRARDVYRAVRERLWSLIGATFMVALLVIVFGMVMIFIVTILISIYGVLAATVGGSLPYWAQMIANFIFGILLIVVAAIASLMVYSRVVYVPQVLMVEGKGVSSSISRSFNLARGEVFRIGAIILFWFYVAMSLWLLLMVPLGWYAYLVGVDINPFNGEDPLWYGIAQQSLTQLSEILIAPIVMLGFTLLYLDSRVRKEGFDVELLANRLLPAPPSPQLPEIHSSHSSPEPVVNFGIPSVLGLRDYQPITIGSSSSNQTL
ncbi:MAG: hypothetical protein L0220_07240, partial [Acidobacteria bacterium]|nr:hypothetical protein [Acidobacteriota bacterium]